MINSIKKNIQNKQILILGFGKEGQSTYLLFRKLLPEQVITIADINIDIIQKNFYLNDDKNLKYLLGKSYLYTLNDFDIIIKTPGISLKDVAYRVDEDKISSQTDLFFNVFSKQIVGVTGTKGKSTTSSLIYHIIHSSTNNTLLVGNIGIPPLSVIDKINSDTKIIYEVSSHQLEFIKKSPHISVLLNLFEEHLDHYKSFLDYQKAKMNIIINQCENDYTVVNADDELIQTHLNKNNLDKQFYTFSLNKKVKRGCFLKGDEIIFSENKKSYPVCKIVDVKHIKGKHNLLNVMAAINVCKILDIRNEQIIKGIRTFIGLSHRLEYVGLYEGIHFYNDSISTIPQATIQAIDALIDVDTLILGGFDRGIDYKDLVIYLNKSNISNLIFMGEAGKRIMNIFNKTSNNIQQIYFVQDMETAVSIAKQKTKQGKICLLSPAAASYGMFKNFEERGEKFITLVKKI